MLRGHTLLLIITICFTDLGTAQPDVVILPFRLAGKQIFIQGSIEGRTGNLIIDTGLPNSYLNRRFFPDVRGFSTGAGSGLRSWWAKDQTTQTAIATFHLGTLKMKNDVQLIDLQALERHKLMDILGIIGIDMFRDYELEIDHLAQELRLYRLDNQGQRIHWIRNRQPRAVLPLTYEDHLLCITARSGERFLRLGLDTGAEMNLLAAGVTGWMDITFGQAQPTTLMDLNGERRVVNAVQMPSLQLGPLDTPSMSALLIPSGKHDHYLRDKRLHGILGYEFFLHFDLSINFRTKELYIWDGPATLLAGGK